MQFSMCTYRGDDWGTLLKDWQYDHVYLDTHSYQCFNLWDLASDRLYIYMYIDLHTTPYSSHPLIHIHLSASLQSQERS